MVSIKVFKKTLKDPELYERSLKDPEKGAPYFYNEYRKPRLPSPEFFDDSVSFGGGSFGGGSFGGESERSSANKKTKQTRKKPNYTKKLESVRSKTSRKRTRNETKKHMAFKAGPPEGTRGKKKAKKSN